jgi:cell division transport system ATP-binding protein
MATHNFEIVNSMKERVIELEKGRLVSDQKKGKYHLSSK